MYLNLVRDFGPKTNTEKYLLLAVAAAGIAQPPLLDVGLASRLLYLLFYKQ